MPIRTDRIENWAFVTGVIRSGTTILGTVLTLPCSVDYIHEPFNGGYTRDDRQALLPRYVRPGDASDAAQAFRRRVARLYAYDIGMRTAHHDADSWPRRALKALVGSRGPFYLRLAKLNPFHRAAVLKDPMGRMAAEFLYREFDTIPVILVRHPVSLAASLKRVGWWPEMREFAVQPDLIEDYFADEKAFLAREWPNRLLEAMAHWRATYKVLLQQAQQYPDWQVVTHEDFCEQPVQTTRRLYNALNLPWSSAYAEKIRALTGTANPTRPRAGRVQDVRRNSARLFEMRRDAIPPDERRRIFEVVQDVALDVYSRESFAID